MYPFVRNVAVPEILHNYAAPNPGAAEAGGHERGASRKENTKYRTEFGDTEGEKSNRRARGSKIELLVLLPVRLNIPECGGSLMGF